MKGQLWSGRSSKAIRHGHVKAGNGVPIRRPMTPLGSVGYENKTNGQGEKLIWPDAAMQNSRE
jgi:hypothetical protein